MTYFIHPSHDGYGDQENLPHVHVCFGSRSDKGLQVSVSLENGRAIVAGRDITYRQQKEAEEFVKDNWRKLMEEWNSKSGNDW